MPPHPSASRTVTLTGIDGRHWASCECGWTSDMQPSEAHAQAALNLHLTRSGA